MTNIWCFLIQTLSVTVVAGLLLIVKTILGDKLSPRWQYGIWSLLAVRILIPVSMKKYLMFPIPLWVESIKAYLERNLDSNYTAVYQIAEIKHIIPILEGKPSSFTDWLLVIYIAGMLGMFSWYLISYLRLKLLLKKSEAVAFEARSKIADICEKYSLKPCKMVAVKNLPSAFVCGGIKPILAIPQEKEVDEKVILHELMHLKYHDELQTVFWCILRCLHWCNPFLQYIFCRIENDMESLCDQRVLERLEGEERREYGVILLNMANEKYARFPGTSSISNGGRNIRRRITAIVRFKKYPRGMELVSICVGIVLFVPILTGISYAYSEEEYCPRTSKELTSAMALARINRCTTIAGALDTYAKGLLYENGIYVASASSLSKHETLERKMKKNEVTASVYLLDAGKEFEKVLPYEGYTVYNLIEIKDDVYEAYLVFSCVNEFDSTTNSLIVPVQIQYEDAWVVEERGERLTSTYSLKEVLYPEMVLPGVKEYIAHGENGNLKISIRSMHSANDHVYDTGAIFENYNDESIKTDAEFTVSRVYHTLEYTFESEEDISKKLWKIKWTELDESEGTHAIWGIMEDERGNRIHRSYLIDEVSDIEKIYEPTGYKAEIYLEEELFEELLVMQSEDSAFTDFALYENQHSAYMNANEKTEFKKEKDQIHIEQKNADIIGKISDDEIYRLIEEYFFAVGNEYEIQEKLESYGIYRFSSLFSLEPTIQNWETEILRPVIFYNANDESWIVACGGYCWDSDTDSDIHAGSVSDEGQFGIAYSKASGSYDTFIVDTTSNIRDELENEVAETKYHSGGDGSNGFIFEIQNHTDSDGIKRWFGACTYANGFEKYDAEITAFYE